MTMTLIAKLAAAERSTADVAQSQRQQQRREEVLNSSFPGEVHRLLLAATIPPVDALSDALKSDLIKHNGERASVATSLQTTLQELAAAMVDAESTDDYGAVLVAAESCRIDRPTVAQQAVKIYATAAALAERKAAELQAVATEAEAAAAVALDKAKDALTAAGSGIESLPRYADNPEAAEIVFTHLARRNIHAARALAAAEDATAQHRAAVDEMYRAQRGLADAKTFLRRLIEKAIA
jgi:hypothetical protein